MPEQAVDRRLLGRIEREIRVLAVARDEPRALERAAATPCNPPHQPLELLRARGRHGHQPQTTLRNVPAIDAVEHEHVKVHVEIERASESLYQCHGASIRLVSRRAAHRSERGARGTFED